MKNKTVNPLKNLLTSDDCFVCHSCCKFSLDDCIDAPMFSQPQSRRTQNEHRSKDISFNKVGKLRKIVLNSIPGQKGRFVCPLYDKPSGECLVYNYRPFDCQTWPFYIMKDQNKIVIALTMDCPSVAKRYLTIDKTHLEEIISYMVKKAQKNPDLITEYLPKHKIIFDVTDRFYVNKIVYGLGNPDQENSKNRHNIGWMVLEYLYHSSKVIIPWKEIKNKEFIFSKIVIEDREIILCKPMRYMNDQGICLARATKFFNIDTKENLLVIHDELDLPFGKIKIKQNGSSKSHNGLKSVMEVLKTEDFWRLKIGIESRTTDSKKSSLDFVLDNFSQKEFLTIKKVVKGKCLGTILLWLKKEFQKTIIFAQS